MGKAGATLWFILWMPVVVISLFGFPITFFFTIGAGFIAVAPLLMVAAKEEGNKTKQSKDDYNFWEV